MKKILLLFLIAVAAISCNVVTVEYRYTNKMGIADTEVLKQTTIDLLEASDDRQYADKTKNRYDIPDAYRVATWLLNEPVEGVEVKTFGYAIASQTLFILEKDLDSLQLQYYNISKETGGAPVIIEIKIKPTRIKYENQRPNLLPS